MKRTLRLLATLAVLGLAPAGAEAQRGARGTVFTPYGQFNQNEMRAAGNDPLMAEQIREQKMMMLYQQQLMKQQQQYMQQMARQQKARQDYLKAHPEAARALADQATARPATKTAKSAVGKSTRSARVPGAPDASTRAK